MFRLWKDKGSRRTTSKANIKDAGRNLAQSITVPWWFYIAVFTLNFIDDVVIGWLSGNWNSRPKIVGVFDINNIPPLIMSLIIEPGLWAFYIGFPIELFELLKKLRSRVDTLEEKESIRQQTILLGEIRYSRWFAALAAIPAFGLAYYATRVILSYAPTPWFVLAGHFWIYFIRVFVASYIATLSIAWSLLAALSLRLIFSTTKIRVDPYDGDNAGGLRFIGTFILKVGRLTLIVVPFLIAETLFALRLGHGLWGQFNLWLEILVLPLLLIAIIFLPLTACRRAMFVAKDDFVNPLRDNILTHIKSHAYPPTPASKTSLEDIKALVDLQARIQKEFPVWPFDITMTQQLGVNFLLTLLPLALSILRELFGGFTK